MAQVNLWRIGKSTQDYSADDLTGVGAGMHGGRWNRKGVNAVYCSVTISLATLETLAHLGNVHIRNAFLVRVVVPEVVWNEREFVAPEDLEPDWLAEPPGRSSIEFGNHWLKSCSAPLLLVPSVIVPEEFNVMINPKHSLAPKIRAHIERPYIYDPRLKS
jgi:RES domain-containing protein